jgi:N-acylneuraminate cytidylyltransferase
MLKKKIYAFICARGGSKGIKNKNIKLFCGKPLISYSIKSALKNKMIKKVIVSTDSEKISKISKIYGAEVPFKRPKKLAQDNSKEWLVWKHLMNFLKTKNDLPDIVISLPTTSPLRKDIDINNCINKFIRNKKSDMLITVTKPHRNPFFNMIQIKKNKFAKILNENKTNYISNRQEAPTVYDVATVAYVTTPRYILRANKMFFGDVDIQEVPKIRAVDIDNKIDFEYAEYLKRKDR